MITCPNCQHKIEPARPEKCRCCIEEWPLQYQTGEVPMPPICDHYEADIDGTCVNCEHDEACHE